MQCPQCGAEVPDGAQSCPACGAGPAQAPQYAPPPPQYAPPPAQYAPPPAQYAQPAPAYGAPVAPQAPPKKKTGLIIALVVLGVLLLCCLVGGAGGYWWYVSQQSGGKTSAGGSASTKSSSSTSASVDEEAELDAAAAVVEDYYAAVAAGDMDAINTLLASSVAEEVGPDWYEGWDPSTTFEYTRGILDGDTITIYGRESVQTLGSGGDGGVEFTLVKQDGSWRITGWAGADRAQIEGSDTTGSSTGADAGLTEDTAADLVTRLVEARRAGNANEVRQLTTKSFQSANGDVWLDGIPTAEYFTSYQIEDVVIAGDMAVVTVTEDWNSGTETAEYGVVRQGGSLLVDSWDSSQ